MNLGNPQTSLKKSPLLPLPPKELVGRVSGSEDITQFAELGAMTLDNWARALNSINKTFNDFQNIVDFGCGCGRVLRHLRPNLRSDQNLIGMDVDAEAIEWVSNSYPTITAIALDLMPPSSLADSSIDLIVNQSVFTHLPEDVQYAWLTDLHRILKPGGIAVISFHGRKVWREYCRDLIAANRGDEAVVQSESYYKRGFYYVQGRTSLEIDLPEYYGSAFHAINYIEECWSKYFKIQSWLPVASLNHQDILVLERN